MQLALFCFATPPHLVWNEDVYIEPAYRLAFLPFVCSCLLSLGSGGILFVSVFHGDEVMSFLLFSLTTLRGAEHMYVPPLACDQRFVSLTSARTAIIDWVFTQRTARTAWC